VHNADPGRHGEGVLSFESRLIGRTHHSCYSCLNGATNNYLNPYPTGAHAAEPCVGVLGIFSRLCFGSLEFTDHTAKSFWRLFLTLW
jgi:hypothetical protein